MRYVWIVLLVLVMVTPLSAQDEAVDCDPNAIAEQLTIQMALLEDDTVNALLEIFSISLSSLGDCTGQNYHFSSEAQGQNTVVGPVEMAEGIYVVTLTTSGIATVSPTAIGDGCGFDLSLTFFAEFGGGAADGAQKVVEIESDCGVLWEFSNMQNDWTFDIEKAG